MILPLLESLDGELRHRIPGSVLCFAFVREEGGGAFSGTRVDLLYSFSEERHAGLLHWCDELCWYHGDTFVEAMELSKFCRLWLKGHAYASGLCLGTELWGQYDWSLSVPTGHWTVLELESLNRWLHEIRAASHLGGASSV